MEVLCSWGEEVLNGIEFVSIDLWTPYKSLVEKLMPNATVKPFFKAYSNFSAPSSNFGFSNYKIN